MVVREVSIIALPTRVSVTSVATVVVAPFFRSSLYLCSAWSESSIPKARTNIGSKLENCDLAIIEKPKNDEKLAT